jgi:hypothetical protein
VAASPRPVDGREATKDLVAFCIDAKDGRGSFGVASTIDRSLAQEEDTENAMTNEIDPILSFSQREI